MRLSSTRPAALTVIRVLSRPYVGRVIVANPMQVKAIAHARIKTDKINAGVLVQLHASVKDEMHGSLQAHLVPKARMPICSTIGVGPGSSGRCFPTTNGAAIARHIRETGRLAEDLADLDRDIAREAV
ncbi:hypothetical protein [Mesorhizobium sp. M0998]|uniref:hypothetical protein n=1 Tax=Mesorhizobium sp. M0998 TaxID=2957044 RepID=UPI003334D1E1